MKGLVARILESSFIDGPGHRAVIFLQGCDMRCLYCHNPETQRLCVDCGECLVVCPSGALSMEAGKLGWSETLCTRCDACIAICPHRSSPRILALSPEDTAARIAPLVPFIDGVTFSGGECTQQPDYLAACARAIKALDPRLTVFADTNGGTDEAVFGALVEVLDGFIFDLKAPRPERHLALTGRPLEPVLHNLKAAARAGKLVELRSVLIEGWNDSEEELAETAGILASLGCRAPLRLIPFRPYGVRGEFAALRAYPLDRFRKLVSLASDILGDRVLTPAL